MWVLLGAGVAAAGVTLAVRQCVGVTVHSAAELSRVGFVWSVRDQPVLSDPVGYPTTAWYVSDRRGAAIEPPPVDRCPDVRARCADRLGAADGRGRHCGRCRAADAAGLSRPAVAPVRVAVVLGRDLVRDRHNERRALLFDSGCAAAAALARDEQLVRHIVLARGRLKGRRAHRTGGAP